MVQLQVEAEKLKLSCNVLPTGLAPEGIKLSNIWIQLAHETKGLIAQDYLQGKVDEDGLLQLEVHRLGINELGRYRLIVKYSYESPERSTEGSTKYECILPAFEVVREERSQRLGTSELVAQGTSVQPLGLPTASVAGAEPSASNTMSPELLETLQALKRETALDDSQEFSYHPERMTEGLLGQEPQRVTLALRTEWLNQKVENLNTLLSLQGEELSQLKQHSGGATATSHGQSDYLLRVVLPAFEGYAYRERMAQADIDYLRALSELLDRKRLGEPIPASLEALDEFERMLGGGDETFRKATEGLRTDSFLGGFDRKFDELMSAFAENRQPSYQEPIIGYKMDSYSDFYEEAVKLIQEALLEVEGIKRVAQNPPSLLSIEETLRTVVGALNTLLPPEESLRY